MFRHDIDYLSWRSIRSASRGRSEAQVTCDVRTTLLTMQPDHAL